MKKYIIISILLLSTLCATAQVNVTAKIDTVNILIGEQAHLTLSAIVPMNAKVQFPTPTPQEITHGVEVLEATEPHTEDIGDGQKSVSVTYTITAFDEHLYAIPAIKIKVDGKDYVTNVLALKVETVDVDTLHAEKFYPPKSVQNNPFSWKEWQQPFYLSLLIVLLCVALFVMVLILRRNKPIKIRLIPVKKVLPHQRALKNIDKIKKQHLTVSEDQKEYYTQLTNVLRQYIAERFGFNAMEMVSDEIIERLGKDGDGTMISELHDLFYTADLVKFAKYSALINENDLNLLNAIQFIDKTKNDETPVESVQVSNISDTDKQIIKMRRVVKTLIGITSVIIIALIIYIVYSTLQLLM